MEKIYHDIKHPLAYTSSPHLISKKLGIALSDVKKFLQSDRTYTLHKPVKLRMKKYRKYRSPKAFYQLQADLVEMIPMAKRNKGYRYILTVIDIFSRFGWAIPMKRKTGVEVVKCLKNHIDLKKTVYLQTDLGKEFYNRTVQDYLKSQNVQLFSVHSPQKCALVERFNRTIKTKMYKYFTHKNTQCWIDIIDDVVSVYNQTPHSSLPKKMTPVKASLPENHWGIWLDSYKVDGKTTKNVLPINQPVRISKRKKTFKKGYLPNWSEEIFFVEKVDKKDVPVMYVLRDYKNEVIKGKFYRGELQPVSLPEKWPIEKIIKKHKNGGALVKFLGYPELYTVKSINKR